MAKVAGPINNGDCLLLKNPAGAILTIGDLSYTIYTDKPNEVNGWGKFYLPKEVSMQVVGVVEGVSCTCDQLVLMTCEDKKVYAYDGEELHEVASCMDTLLKRKEIEYPSSKSYYNGQAFQHMTNKDWDKVRKSDVGKSLEEAHHKLVKELMPGLLENLKIISTGIDIPGIIQADDECRDNDCGLCCWKKHGDEIQRPPYRGVPMDPCPASSS